MRLIAMLIGGLRMLLRTLGVLFPLGVIALAMMLGCSAMRLGRVFVVLGGLVMFVACHCTAPYRLLPAATKSPARQMVPGFGNARAEMFRADCVKRRLRSDPRNRRGRR